MVNFMATINDIKTADKFVFSKKTTKSVTFGPNKVEWNLNQNVLQGLSQK